LGGEGNEDWDTLCYEAGRAAANEREREVVREEVNVNLMHEVLWCRVQSARCRM
jgi:hypothetical protein